MRYEETALYACCFIIIAEDEWVMPNKSWERKTFLVYYPDLFCASLEY